MDNAKRKPVRVLRRTGVNRGAKPMSKATRKRMQKASVKLMSKDQRRAAIKAYKADRREKSITANKKKYAAAEKEREAILKRETPKKTTKKRVTSSLKTEPKPAAEKKVDSETSKSKKGSTVTTALKKSIIPAAKITEATINPTSTAMRYAAKKTIGLFKNRKTSNKTPYKERPKMTKKRPSGFSVRKKSQAEKLRSQFK